MRYSVAFNVLDRGTGRPTPLRVSVEVRDVSRWAAVRAARILVLRHGIAASEVPSSVKSVGAPTRARGAPKVRLPSL